MHPTHPELAHAVTNVAPCPHLQALAEVDDSFINYARECMTKVWPMLWYPTEDGGQALRAIQYMLAVRTAPVMAALSALVSPASLIAQQGKCLCTSARVYVRLCCSCVRCTHVHAPPDSAKRVCACVRASSVYHCNVLYARVCGGLKGKVGRH